VWVYSNANNGSLEGGDHLDSSISFIVTQYSAKAMCESWVLIFNHTLVLVLVLIVELPGRSCGYCSYGYCSCGYCSYGTYATRVAHFKRKAVAFAALVTASNETAAALRAAEPVSVARFKRKKGLLLVKLLEVRLTWSLVRLLIMKLLIMLLIVRLLLVKLILERLLLVQLPGRSCSCSTCCCCCSSCS
jgi:hypothetical protein